MAGQAPGPVRLPGWLRGSLTFGLAVPRIRVWLRPADVRFPVPKPRFLVPIGTGQSRFRRKRASRGICGSPGSSEKVPDVFSDAARGQSLPPRSGLTFPCLLKGFPYRRVGRSPRLDDLKLRLEPESRKRIPGMFSTARRKYGGQVGGLPSGLPILRRTIAGAAPISLSLNRHRDAPEGVAATR